MNFNLKNIVIRLIIGFSLAALLKYLLSGNVDTDNGTYMQGWQCGLLFTTIQFLEFWKPTKKKKRYFLVYYKFTIGYGNVFIDVEDGRYCNEKMAIDGILKTYFKDEVNNENLKIIISNIIEMPESDYNDFKM